MSRRKRRNELVRPFVKWVGGKRQLLAEIKRYIPQQFSRYYEPFVGGGAVLFHLQPKKAVINDSNEELVNLYEVIKKAPDKLIQELKEHKNEEAYFYEIRGLDRDKALYRKLNNIQRASRIIYLNKTCYNGLFRVNSAGEFNSPFGRYKNPNIVNEITIRAVSNYLAHNDIRILNTDYEKALANIRKGSFVYFDPPYDPVSNSANFTGYTKGGFGRDEQARLKSVCDRLDERGVKFLLSNSATDFIKELYADYSVSIVHANRAVNSKANGRGKIAEVLIRNYA
ncbi:DNA adenine methylase [Candidatus Leptofilum sp.]|uniref:DNA adenine methylase n=1 Tax=Candidatus Leptofilum sp. TaxID=3241576 RepID=UPI003B59CEA1